MKNKLLLLPVLICGWLFSIPGISGAQTLDSIKSRFPDEKAVFLTKLLSYDISLKDGAVNVESHATEQIEFLTDDATAYMGGYGFSHSDFRQLGAYEAYTRTPDDKKLKVNDFKTSTDKEDFVFYDDVKETRFNFPSVEPGAIGNLDVSWQNKDPHLLSPFYFTSYIPVINSELKITVSKDISLRYKLMGLDTSNISVNIDDKHHNKIYTFQYKNCPAEKNYSDAPNPSWYLPHVIFYIENHKDANGTTVSDLSNADDLYRLNYSFIKNINTQASPQLKHIADSLTANAPGPESKARAIYSWVQHEVKYVAFEDGMGGFVPRDANLVCSRRYGDCKDMASILTEMLTVAGVPAYFTWIGTRDLPYKYSKLPLPLVSNHMICTVQLNGKFIFLDATDPACVFGMPSSGIQDKEAMIGFDEKTYKIVTVPTVEKESNMLTDTTWMAFSPDGIKGNIKRNLQGYFAVNVHDQLMYSSKKDLKEYLKDQFTRGSNKFQLDTFNIEKKQTTNNITISADFDLAGYAKKIGNDYFLNLNLFKFYANARLDDADRKAPVDKDFRYVKKYVVILKIPDGYKLSYLPQSKSYHNQVWGFDLHYEQKNNEVILTQEFDNEKLMLNDDEFKLWNNVLDNLFPLYKETLSFTKI